ncbi:helix-turn-helix domain-containing protein [Exiguobacterium sp. TDN 0502]|uniref:helix-turn-helix domain-containing protein n=1 Tax=Exiguobacterium sp. TDN 0502 TaxID=3420731 RepID=UPI003D7851D3
MRPNVSTTAIGSRIKQMRTQKRMSQHELCKGICSQAEISKIENNLNSPTVELLQRLANRLKIPISVLFENQLPHEAISGFDQKVSELLREENYEEVLNVTNLNDNHEQFEIRILSNYFRIIAEVKRNYMDFRTAASLLSNFVHDNGVWHESISLYIRIKTAIANLYAENEMYHLTTKVYIEMERLLEQLESSTYMTTLIKLYFNHAQILLYQDLFDEGLCFIEKGISCCLNYQLSFLLGHFYFQLANYEEATGKLPVSFQKTYSVAYALMHALDHQATKKMIVELKGEHLLFTFEPG